MIIFKSTCRENTTNDRHQIDLIMDRILVYDMHGYWLFRKIESRGKEALLFHIIFWFVNVWVCMWHGPYFIHFKKKKIHFNWILILIYNIITLPILQQFVMLSLMKYIAKFPDFYLEGGDVKKKEEFFGRLNIQNLGVFYRHWSILKPKNEYNHDNYLCLVKLLGILLLGNRMRI